MKKGLTCLLFVSVCFASLGRAQEMIEGIIAVVGDEIILKSDFLQSAQGLAIQMGINPMVDKDAFEKLKKQVLDNMINEKVLLAKAEEDTIVVDDQQVETELENRTQSLIQQLGSKEKVEAYFGAPISKIKRNYREEVKKGLIVQMVRHEREMGMQISRREVENFYQTMKDSLPEKKETVHLRHILMQVKPREESQQEAQKLVDTIKARLKAGDSFEELAKEYSQDPGSAQKGGSLGMVRHGVLFREFEDAALMLEPGEVSDVVQTPVGYHMIQMVEKKEGAFHARHILIRLDVTDQDADATFNKLKEVREMAIRDSSFEKLAEKYSDDESTRFLGGDLGWLPIAELQIQAFAQAADTLDVGDISQPFQTPFGYHIVKLEGKREAHKINLEDDWDQIREWAFTMKRERLFNEWVDELKADMYIKVNEDRL